MIQDIGPAVFSNAYEPTPPRGEDTVFVFDGKKVLICGDPKGGRLFPRVKDLELPAGEPGAAGAVGSGDAGTPAPEDPGNETAGGASAGGAEAASRLQFLFRIDEQAFFLYLQAFPKQEEQAVSCLCERGYGFIDLMKVRGIADMPDMFACMTAFHLFTWYDKNRRCGRCGGQLVHGEKERMLRCPDCGNMVFPVIAPAVIVGVTDGERILMTKYAGREYTGWALIAGFCEIGESVEDTVCREVMEEAGIRVKDLRYAGSQPWGSDLNLLIGVFCEADGETGIHMDTEELARAVWIDRPDVPEMKDNHSLTGHMVELFRTGKDKA